MLPSATYNDHLAKREEREGVKWEKYREEVVENAGGEDAKRAESVTEVVEEDGAHVVISLTLVLLIMLTTQSDSAIENLTKRTANHQVRDEQELTLGRRG